MNILITIDSTSELICYEAAALAMTYATFEHHVQLWLKPACYGVLLQPNNRLTGMIKSLELYDMPKAWFDSDTFSGWLNGMVNPNVMQQTIMVPDDKDISQFDEVLFF